MGMVLQMKNPEGHRAGREIWKIGQNPDHFVPAFAPQNQIMGCIVNDHVVGMIHERAHTIGDEQAEPPVIESEFPHQKRNRRLQNHGRKREQSGIRISYHQLSNSRMRLDDGPCPAWVRLIEDGLVKAIVHRFSND